MKKNKFGMYILFLILLIIPLGVLAGGKEDNSNKKEYVTCTYDKVTFIQKTGNDAETYVKVKVVMYEDGTSTMYIKDQDENYNDVKSSSYIALYQNEKKNNTTVVYSSFSKTDAFRIYQELGNNCPLIKLNNNQGVTLSYANTSAECGGGYDTFCSDGGVKSSTNDAANNEETVTISKSCQKTISKGQISAVPAMDFKLNMYTDGKRELCVELEGKGSSCNSIKASDIDSTSDSGVLYTNNVGGGAGQGYTIYIRGTQMDDIFKQNAAQLNNNQFTCPVNLYVVETALMSDGQYELTTDKDFAKDYKYNTNASDGSNINEDGTQDNSGNSQGSGTDGGQIPDYDIDDNFECTSIPKTIQWLQKIFNIIKIAGPLLVMGLGIYDYIQAIYSSDDDALKKANKKFMKRVIAACVLFLLPYLLEMILGLVDKFGDNPLCGIK